MVEQWGRQGQARQQVEPPTGQQIDAMLNQRASIFRRTLEPYNQTITRIDTRLRGDEGLSSGVRDTIHRARDLEIGFTSAAREQVDAYLGRLTPSAVLPREDVATIKRVCAENPVEVANAIAAVAAVGVVAGREDARLSMTPDQMHTAATRAILTAQAYNSTQSGAKEAAYISPLDVVDSVVSFIRAHPQAEETYMEVLDRYPSRPYRGAHDIRRRLVEAGRTDNNGRDRTETPQTYAGLFVNTEMTLSSVVHGFEVATRLDFSQPGAKEGVATNIGKANAEMDVVNERLEEKRGEMIRERILPK